jgi:hypothetical protein
MDEFRRELAELFREDDRLRAEHDDWQARRDAQAKALVQKEVLYRVCDNNALAPATYQEPEPFNEEQVDTLAHLINLLRAEWRRDIARLARRLRRVDSGKHLDKAEIAELRGQVSKLLTVLGSSDQIRRLERMEAESKPPEVIDLPDWRSRLVAAE